MTTYFFLWFYWNMGIFQEFKVLNPSFCLANLLVRTLCLWMEICFYLKKDKQMLYLVLNRSILEFEPRTLGMENKCAKYKAKDHNCWPCDQCIEAMRFPPQPLTFWPLVQLQDARMYFILWTSGFEDTLNSSKGPKYVWRKRKWQVYLDGKS